MKIIKYTSPCQQTPALDLIEKIFGKFERDLETPQLDGTETKHNNDFIYLATEDDTVLGMIHITIPKHAPHLAGVSGVCTTEAARGKGVGKALFGAAMDEIDRLGVKYSFLGTGNPIAAKMYSSFGFSYVQNTSIMMRITDGGMIDFHRFMYDSPLGKITVTDDTAASRIPAIPLMIYRHSSVILDINVGLLSTCYLPQICCMSLYPRYMQLKKDGGRVLNAIDEDGVLGAMASVARDDDGTMRIDFFAVPAFKTALSEMIKKLIPENEDYYFELSASDGAKIEILEELGYIKFADSEYRHGPLVIPTVKYRKA